MRSMQYQLGVLDAISAFAYRQRETNKNLCRDGRYKGTVSGNKPTLSKFYEAGRSETFVPIYRSRLNAFRSVVL
jgi:hypothetical protein